MSTPQKPSLKEQARKTQVDDIAGLWKLDEAIKDAFLEGYANENQHEEIFDQIYAACQWQISRNNISGIFEARYHYYMALVEQEWCGETGNFGNPRWHCRLAKSIYEGLRPRVPENGLDVEELTSFLNVIDDLVDSFAVHEEAAAARRRNAEKAREG